jgi:hypothetical protein
VLRIFKCSFTTKRFNSKNGENLRQQTFLSISCLRQQNSPLGLFDKTNLLIVPKNGPLICASKLQVHCHLNCIYKLNCQINVQVRLQVNLQSVIVLL